MKKSEEILRLEKDLAQNKELSEQFKIAMEEAGKSGECKCDGEVMVRAAASLGYEISLAEIERMAAESEKLELGEMEKIAGGNCDKDWDCNFDYQGCHDEHGLHHICVVTWHCLTAFMHTESEDHQNVCFSDYSCLLAYHLGAK